MGTSMKPFESTFVAAARVRQALVGDGDIRAEIDFQNDINAMLAAIEDGSSLAVGPGVAMQGSAETPTETPAETLAATAASARQAGLRPSRPGSGRRGAPGREATTPYVSLATSVWPSA
jgi:hypothetical protein